MITNNAHFGRGAGEKKGEECEDGENGGKQTMFFSRN